MASVAATCISQIFGAIFDASPAARGRLPRELRDDAALRSRLAFWQDLQREP
jgi:hypothetical protein